jgi:hypothetical protein
MCVSVPVIFVRRRDQANTTNDDGIRITAKTGKAAMEGHSWFHPAPASSAARISSSEYVTGIKRARNRSRPGNTLMGYIIPPSRPEIPSTIRSVTLMAGNITKLNLTSDQQRPIMDATGKGVTELDVNPA